MKTMKLLLIVGLILVSSCSIFNHRNSTTQAAYDKVPISRNNGTCKELVDTVVLYAVFVDVSIYHPWTEFDINSTLDSIQTTVSWLENQALQSGKKIKIDVVQHIQGSKHTIKEKSASYHSLKLNGLYAPNHKRGRKFSPWADDIAKYAGRGAKYKPSTKIAERLRISDVMTFTLALRDKYERENVAVMFFVNGFMENHPSYTFYSEQGQNQLAEYSIVTNKSTTIIAHEFMHLFGAIDLYPNMNYPNFNYSELNETYPNEIMYVQHKDLHELMVSPINRYFMGWQDTLSKPDNDMLFHKVSVLDY